MCTCSCVICNDKAVPSATPQAPVASAPVPFPVPVVQPTPVAQPTPTPTPTPVAVPIAIPVSVSVGQAVPISVSVAPVAISIESVEAPVRAHVSSYASEVEQHGGAAARDVHAVHDVHDVHDATAHSQAAKQSDAQSTSHDASIHFTKYSPFDRNCLCLTNSAVHSLLKIKSAFTHSCTVNNKHRRIDFDQFSRIMVGFRRVRGDWSDRDVDWRSRRGSRA